MRGATLRIPMLFSILCLATAIRWPSPALNITGNSSEVWFPETGAPANSITVYTRETKATWNSSMETNVIGNSSVETNVTGNSSKAWPWEMFPFRPTLRMSPFRNILLVVHCRLRRGLHPEICAERKPVFDGYSRYFEEVRYITNHDCHGLGDPHICVAKLMEGPAAMRDGIFYMHFDALIRPRHLAPFFDKHIMYSFNQAVWCDMHRTYPAEEYCPRSWWGADEKGNYRNHINQLIDTGASRFANLHPWEYWISNDVVFYLPRRVYKLYSYLAHHFLIGPEEVHEVAGPTIRSIISNLTGVPTTSLNCSGSCLTVLEGKIALQPNFACGHSFDLAEKQTRDAFPIAISTISAESWRKIVQDVLE